MTPATRTALREAAFLGLLAASPAVPYAVILALHAVPRFSMFGDYAILELVTRWVRNGHTLFGPYSRFRFSHPGPAYFYVMAVFYELCGRQSSGLFVGAFAVNSAAIVATVSALRLLASRVHAVAAAVVLVAWMAAFGDVFANAWNPLITALPLVAFLVLAALFALGESAAALPAVFFGAFVAQAHLATVITFVAAGLAASVAYVVRRRRDLSRRDRRQIAWSLALLAVMFAPVLVEQVTSQEGNLTKIVHFFLHSPERPKPLSTGLRNWAFATSWLPDRLFGADLRTDGVIPFPMRWDAVPSAATPTLVHLATVHVACVLLGGVVAWRRRDRVSLSLLAEVAQKRR
jgi:hypothetical protein